MLESDMSIEDKMVEPKNFSIKSDDDLERGYVSGRLVVLGMLGFGVVMTSTLFAYWYFYTRPFRDLQTAIAAEFSDSSPRAVGGKHKSHQTGSRSMLRVIVRTQEDLSQQEDKARQRANTLAGLAEKHTDLSPYQDFHIVLMFLQPQKATVTWSVLGPMEEFPLPTEGELAESVEVSVSTRTPEANN